MCADRGAGLIGRSTLELFDLTDKGVSVDLVEQGESEMDMSSKCEMSEQESFSGE